tara:strand:+ start:178 stop:819 length:642 start_codon:yes stop_codon:yes gene_type:complete
MSRNSRSATVSPINTSPIRKNKKTAKKKLRTTSPIRKSPITKSPSKKKTAKKPSPIRRSPARPKKQNKIGEIHQIDYLVGDKGIVSYDDVGYYKKLSFEFIEKELDEHVQMAKIGNISNKIKALKRYKSNANKWRLLKGNLKENDVVWQSVKLAEQCDRAVYLVIKINGGLHLTLFPSYSGQKSITDDEWSDGDCIVDGSMIHPITKKLVKIF